MWSGVKIMHAHVPLKSRTSGDLLLVLTNYLIYWINKLFYFSLKTQKKPNTGTIHFIYLDPLIQI